MDMISFYGQCAGPLFNTSFEYKVQEPNSPLIYDPCQFIEVNEIAQGIMLVQTPAALFISDILHQSQWSYTRTEFAYCI